LPELFLRFRAVAKCETRYAERTHKNHGSLDIFFYYTGFGLGKNIFENAHPVVEQPKKNRATLCTGEEKNKSDVC